MEIDQTQSALPVEKKESKLLVYLLVALFLIALAAVVYWYMSFYNKPAETVTSTTVTARTSNQITNDAQLEEVDKQLNSANLDGLGSDLDKNDTDAASF